MNDYHAANKPVPLLFAISEFGAAYGVVCHHATPFLVVASSLVLSSANIAGCSNILCRGAPDIAEIRWLLKTVLTHFTALPALRQRVECYL